MTEKPVVIVGAGGLARELTSWLEQDNRHVLGYLVDPGLALDDLMRSVTLLSEDAPQTAPAIIAIGSPRVKQAVYRRMKDKGWRFATFVHSSAVLGSNVQLLEGCVVCPKCIVSPNVRIGVCSYVNFGSSIGHETEVGNYVQINPGVQIGGNCHIGAGTLLGSGSTIIEHTNIGKDCVIGSGSVIYSTLRDSAHTIAPLARRMRAFE